MKNPTPAAPHRGTKTTRTTRSFTSKGKIMRSSLKRALTATGALALAAGAVLLPASAAQADGAYYGKWKLTAWRVDGVTIPCPGKLEIPPPAPSISCNDHEKLVLRANYRYAATLKVLTRLEEETGDFEILKFPNSVHKVIVFDPNSDGTNPRAYRMQLIGSRAGTPNKMKIYLATTSRDGSKSTAEMIFFRMP